MIEKINYFSDYTGINEMLAVTKIKHDENQFSNFILNKNRHRSGKRCIQFAIHVFNYIFLFKKVLKLIS